ncbi:YraN family protein [Saltatorellus ferox]|uniref:YraN family protein n=1 Tax=Saltatorellus ferox TaxID=2528018 RepID=UPI003AF33FA0
MARAPARTEARTGAAGRWDLTRSELGLLGEELAARFLRSRGWRLVGRNLRAEEAELDLVGLDGRTLVVIEVKTGWWPLAGAEAPGSLAGEWARRRPGARVTDQALARRRSAARRLARSEGFPGSRVDVVEVISGRGPSAIVLHHRNFTPGSFSSSNGESPRE